MPTDKRHSQEQSTQSGQSPGVPAHEAVTGKFLAHESESTGQHHALSGDSSRDSGHGGSTGDSSGGAKQHGLSSGPPTIPGYDIVGELGRGGMGVVYKAWHVPSKRFVALKMIITGAEASETQRKRFRVEAEAATRLAHPNIIQVHEVGEFQGHPYFSLEFCGGGSLAKKLSGNPMLPQAAALVVEKLARAVAVAHHQQIIHRDLKPGNILLSSETEPKISDFGLAKRLDSEDVQTRTGAVMGTPSYMPPEQAIGAGQHVGTPVDIYALGAILYECLTGRPPFKSATAVDTLDQVKRQEPVAPRLLNATVPAELDLICLKCLRKSPEQRYATATELADELRRYLSGEPIRTRPISSLTRAGQWISARPIQSGLLAIAVGAILVAAVIGVLSLLR
jgi:eukaryotic-like serine/threonine-protein kinase